MPERASWYGGHAASSLKVKSHARTVTVGGGEQGVLFLGAPQRVACTWCGEDVWTNVLFYGQCFKICGDGLMKSTRSCCLVFQETELRSQRADFCTDRGKKKTKLNENL